MSEQEMTQYGIEHAVLHALARGDRYFATINVERPETLSFQFLQTPQYGVLVVTYDETNDVTIVMSFAQWRELASGVIGPEWAAEAAARVERVVAVMSEVGEGK